LSGERLLLRELRQSDAVALYEALRVPEVRPFMWAPPPSASAFEQFVDWAHAERAAGMYICYGIVPRGEEHAIGVFELRRHQPGFLRGELGFVMAPRLWGGGAFAEGASLVLDFAFGVVGCHRIEMRAAIDNERGNAVLRKLGARREGRLRAAFVRDDQYIDQYLWSILDSDWLPRGSQPSDK